MNTVKDLRKAPIRIAAAMFCLLFGACAAPPPPPPPPPKPKHVHHKPPPPPAVLVEDAIEFGPDAYLLHLSLAELSLEAHPLDVPAAAADLDIARIYSQQKQAGDILQPIIILEYALKGETEHRRIAIPFTMPHDGDAFENLGDVMMRLNMLSYTMYDLRIAAVNLPALSPLDGEGETAPQVEAIINSRLQPLIGKAAALPPMVAARIELQLTRFFVRYHYKEPAYLAIENAKQSLAIVDETNGNPDATRGLSKEIDAEEGLLYKTMPFTFSF